MRARPRGAANYCFADKRSSSATFRSSLASVLRAPARAMEVSDGVSGGASASSRLAEAARRAFEAGNLAEARRALSDPSLESAMVASGDRHRLAHARAVVDFHDGGGSVDELLERLRLAEADARDSAAARAASSPADDVDVDGVAASRAATHAESDAFHDAFALRANLAWALQASGRAAASAEVLETLFREIDAVAPSAAVRVCAMLVRAARRTGRLERAARVLDRAEAIVTRAEAILPRAAEADATLTDATARLDAGDGVSFDTEPPDPAESDSSPARTPSPVVDARPAATRAWISLERARLSLARAREPADVDDVSARLDHLEKETERERDDATKETYLEAFLAETRVLRAAAAATRGHAADATRLLMDVRETYLASASGCSNLAEAFRRAGRHAAATVVFESTWTKDAREEDATTKDAREEDAREDALAAAAFAALTEGRHVDAELAFESLAWKTPETWLRLAECAVARGTAAKEAPRRARRNDTETSPRGEESIASDAIASSDSFSRACGCLDVADALFSARARVDGERAYPASARAGVAANRAYANLRLARPRAALAHVETLSRLVGGWDGDEGERENEDTDAWMSKFGASKLDALTVDERRAYARVGRCYAAEALFALGRFDESKRITRDAAARDDADFETLTHAARAAYALGDAGGAERLAKRAREAAPNAAEPRLTVAFPPSADLDPAGAAPTLVEDGEKGR